MFFRATRVSFFGWSYSLKRIASGYNWFYCPLHYLFFHKEWKENPSYICATFWLSFVCWQSRLGFGFWSFKNCYSSFFIESRLIVEYKLIGFKTTSCLDFKTTRIWFGVQDYKFVVIWSLSLYLNLGFKFFIGNKKGVCEDWISSFKSFQCGFEGSLLAFVFCLHWDICPHIYNSTSWVLCGANQESLILELAVFLVEQRGCWIQLEFLWVFCVKSKLIWEAKTFFYCEKKACCFWSVETTIWRDILAPSAILLSQQTVPFQWSLCQLGFWVYQIEAPVCIGIFVKLLTATFTFFFSTWFQTLWESPYLFLWRKRTLQVDRSATTFG